MPRFLQGLGKQSAGDVRSIFTLHVYEAAPELSSQKAADISVEDLVSLIAKLVEVGKGRTAGKLRSYLRAAYALAISSRTDPSAPMSMRQFGITVNPVANIGALSQYNKARDRVLSAPELATYLKHLDALPAGAIKDLLALAIHTGGQRPTQLLRARPEDIDLPGSTLTLHDLKGARKQPRRHVVPLVPDATAILTRRLETLADNEPLFAFHGKIPLKPEMLSVIVTDISSAMLKAKDSREPFQLRDIRRTVETMLAGLGVSSDVRAQLQSHGLGGIQIRHYDRHDYMPEKRKALKKWSHHITKLRDGEPSTTTRRRSSSTARAQDRSRQQHSTG
jgi:integrase